MAIEWRCLRICDDELEKHASPDSTSKTPWKRRRGIHEALYAEMQQVSHRGPNNQALWPASGDPPFIYRIEIPDESFARRQRVNWLYYGYNMIECVGLLWTPDIVNTTDDLEDGFLQEAVSRLSMAKPPMKTVR